MRVELAPHVAAIGSAMLAYSVVWAAGLFYGVPTATISLRAIIAAAVFWVAGLLIGRVVVNVICEAVAERLREAENNNSAGQRR